MDTPTLNDLAFDNRFTDALPADPIPDNRRRQVFEACYSYVTPTPVAAPKVMAVSREVAESLGLSEADCQSEAFAQVFGGNALVEGMAPYAMCYGGHQFGNWAGQLGDGRAISLGEAVTPSGGHLELQLKGAGPTPYSRMGDGRAVLRSSIREFLCSEAMHHLGVPTTRALSLVTTGDQVVRDMFYDGNAAPEPGAIVCRVAKTFLRLGSFEIFAARRDVGTLKTLTDFTIRTHFPHLGEPSHDVYAAFFHEVCETTATMIDHWMRVGFVHGVMNTDNLSILGETIDYGPYGWLESYDPGWTPNTTDAGGKRYCFGNQPRIAQWNLACFANALVPLLGETESLEAGLQHYADTLAKAQRETLARKLGFTELRDPEDDDLVRDLLALLERTETDYCIFYRELADVPLVVDSPEQRFHAVSDAYYDLEGMGDDTRAEAIEWLERWAIRAVRDRTPDDVRRARMNGANPKYVMRNYLAQVAIEAAEQGDGSEVNALLDVMRNPYDEQPGREAFAEKRPEWARHKPGCSMLSCSS
ncbi:MAG: protein adenylyltransferase SelO [Myxococcota bacterium]